MVASKSGIILSTDGLSAEDDGTNRPHRVLSDIRPQVQSLESKDKIPAGILPEKGGEHGGVLSTALGSCWS
jgi:hypothetical protein